MMIDPSMPTPKKKTKKITIMMVPSFFIYLSLNIEASASPSSYLFISKYLVYRKRITANTKDISVATHPTKKELCTLPVC